MKLMLVGFGVVGQGLVKILHDKADDLKARYQFEPTIVGVATGSRGIVYRAAVLSMAGLLEAAEKGSLAHYPDEDGLERDFTDASDLIQKGNADVLVEVSPTNIETALPATQHFQIAIATGKHIVTANKGPVAVGFRKLAQQAQDAGVQIRYDATLMAGTPTISLGKQGLAGCTIEAARGIVNGTTNYILTEMENGLSYSEALQQAQALGYAETDPTADVEGFDAAAKVLIMLDTFFGIEATLADIDVTGITSITSEAIKIAAEANECYKLIGKASPAGGEVKLVRLPISDPLANVKGAMNALTLSTDLMGDVTVIGAGAGQSETSAALLADLIALHRSV
ncbi:MAG: homoserine dehydrogenase [Phototrophicaceae bacterium]